MIVSMTSYPLRNNFSHLAVRSILDQTLKPDRVVLYLGRQKYRFGAPRTLKRLAKANEIFEIRFVDDIGPYTKLIPALRDFPGEVIITVDDDAEYTNTLIESLYKTYLKFGCVVGTNTVRMVKAEYNGCESIFHNDCSATIPDKCNFAFGSGGVLYPPGVFTDFVFRQDIFSKGYFKTNDDMWFWLNLHMNNVKSVSPFPHFGWHKHFKWASLSRRQEKAELKYLNCIKNDDGRPFFHQMYADYKDRIEL